MTTRSATHKEILSLNQSESGLTSSSEKTDTIDYNSESRLTHTSEKADTLDTIIGYNNKLKSPEGNSELILDMYEVRHTKDTSINTKSNVNQTEQPVNDVNLHDCDIGLSDEVSSNKNSEERSKNDNSYHPESDGDEFEDAQENMEVSTSPIAVQSKHVV